MFSFLSVQARALINVDCFVVLGARTIDSKEISITHPLCIQVDITYRCLLLMFFFVVVCFLFATMVFLLFLSASERIAFFEYIACMYITTNKQTNAGIQTQNNVLCMLFCCSAADTTTATRKMYSLQTVLLFFGVLFCNNPTIDINFWETSHHRFIYKNTMLWMLLHVLCSVYLFHSFCLFFFKKLGLHYIFIHPHNKQTKTSNVRQMCDFWKFCSRAPCKWNFTSAHRCVVVRSLSSKTHYNAIQKIRIKELIFKSDKRLMDFSIFHAIFQTT